MDVTRGFQVTHDDGSIVFVSQDELYGQKDGTPFVSQKEYQLLFKKLYSQKVTASSKKSDDVYQFSIMRTLLNLALTLIGLTGTILLIQHLGWVVGSLATGGILLVIVFLIWFFGGLFDL